MSRDVGFFSILATFLSISSIFASENFESYISLSREQIEDQVCFMSQHEREKIIDQILDSIANKTKEINPSTENYKQPKGEYENERRQLYSLVSSNSMAPEIRNLQKRKKDLLKNSCEDGSMQEPDNIIHRLINGDMLVRNLREQQIMALEKKCIRLQYQLNNLYITKEDNLALLEDLRNLEKNLRDIEKEYN